jgi:hypothetical protein
MAEQQGQQLSADEQETQELILAKFKEAATQFPQVRMIEWASVPLAMAIDAVVKKRTEALEQRLAALEAGANGGNS